MDESIKILVLIADDDSDTRDILKIALGLKQYKIIEVADGRDMVAKAKIEMPNLIIADVMMPHMDGYNGIKLLREESAFKKVPVIFISGIVSGEAIVSELKSMPFCIYMDKPFNHHELLNNIGNLLAKK